MPQAKLSGAGRAETAPPRRPTPRSARDVEILRALARRIAPGDAGAHNNLGVVYYQKGLVAEAVEAFERALDLDPLLDVAFHNLRVALGADGLVERRIGELCGRLAADPSDTALRRRLGRAYLCAGEAAAAVEEWRLLAQSGEATAGVRIELARAEAERGDLDAALRQLGGALDAGDDPRLLRRVAELLRERGRDEEADAVEARLEGLGDGAEPEATSLTLETDGSRHVVSTGTAVAAGALAHYTRALQLRRAADYDGAERELARALEAGEDAFMVQQAQAELALLRGQGMRAADLYAALVEEEPASPKLWNERGVAAHHQGQLEEAERAYRRALALDAGYALARNNLAVALYYRGDTGAAEAEFRAAAGTGRAPADVWRNLGLMLARDARHEAALGAYRRALELDPRSAAAWSGLGSMLMDLGRPEEAKSALVRAVEADGALAEARYNLAFALSALGDYRGALRETKRALELDPYFPAPRFRLLVDVQFEEGHVLAPEVEGGERVRAGTAVESFEYQEGSLDGVFAEASAPGPLTAAHAALGEARPDADEAGPSFEGVLELAESFLRRGLAGEAVERFDGVLAALERAGSDDPFAEASAQRRALLGRARSLLVLGRAESACEAAERLLRLEPTDAEATRVYAEALLRSGDAGSAVAELERAASLAPGEPAILAELGAACMAAGRTEAAERALRQALALDPDSVTAHTALGRLFDAAGRPDAAAAAYRCALELLPSYGEAALALAALEWRRGGAGAAIGVLVDLMTLDPYHLEALALLGGILQAEGRSADAESAFRRVLVFEPDHAAAREGLRTLGVAVEA